MSKHLADHREPAQSGRMKYFVAIARNRSEAVWQALWRRRFERPAGNRRVVEYVQIERGRNV